MIWPPPTGFACVRLKVTGRVQGVYFRASAVAEAQRLGLSGWVMNRPDGSVEALAEGSRAKLEEFITWCRQGPPGAQVRRCEHTWEESKGELRGFQIRR